MKLSPISASFGAMGSLPQKLDELLSTGHWALSGVVMDEIEELTADLHILCNLLLKLSNVHDPPPTVRFWMKEVRELSYDVEDCADQFVIANDRAVMRRAKIHRATIRTIIITRLKISRLPKRRKWRLWMTDKVAEFRTRVQDATQRYWRYKFDDCASNPGYASVGHEFATVYAQPGDLVGIEGPMDELEQWLTDGEEQLKVISIVGLGGVGKTTLAQKLWATLKGQFLCRAFVRTAQKPDMRGILRNILLQVRPHQLPNRGEMHHLIHDLREYLQDKRYFVIIDDLWAASVWDVVSRAFPEGNCCSRIVTTTEIMEVALACCDYCPKHICKLETLSDDDSEKLLLERIVVSGNQIPQQLDDVLPQIMRNCGGLPLAIIIVASLLVSQPEKLEQWGHTQNSFGSIFGTNPTMEGFIRQILSISFNSLPYYLKTCLLYLSSYPEGCLFLKDDLVKLWVAEGFIHAKEWEDMEDLAGRYFDELVNVGLIQVMDINYNYKLPSYSVHHMVLDFITCKSIEENFITVVDYSETTTPLTDKVRRLSLHFGSATHATTPASARLLNVRSLFYFGLFNCMPSFMVFKLLRVLILNFWGDPGNTSFNLTGICELVWLRYLQVSCNVTVKLPDQIESMGHLETLEIKAKVYAVPLDIVRLSSLSHLHLRGGTIPNGIGCMRSLRTLKYFDLVNKSVDNLWGLGELANLRDLHLTYSSSLPSEHLKRNLIALASSLGKLCNLKSLTLASETAATVVPFDGSISMSSTPAFLERLELLPSICIFSRLPKWIFQFQKLCILKVAVRELLANDIDSITGLPSLTVLSLCVHTAPGQRIVFNDGAFPVLKYFKFRCGVLSMSFMAGAMPNLRRLKLGFNTHVGEKYGNMLAGIEHLLNLQDIAGKIGVATESDRKAAESAIKGAISKHPQSPMLNVQWVDLVEEEYHASEKQHGRQEKGLSGENHAVLEKAKDTKKHADSGVSQLPDLPSTVSSSRLKSENIAQASKHHVLESMLCDESAQPESLEVSVLEDITNNFSDDQEISKNRFVVVYKGELQNGSVVVVKRFTIAIDYNLFLDAVDCLMSVKHNNIVRFLGYCANSQENAAKEGSKSVSVVTQERLCCFEYLRNGNLQMHLTDESCGFDWQMWYQIIEGICQGVHYLHNKSITPLNLNPANIMFDDKMVPKIVHYAYTRFLGQATSPVLTNIGDPWAYMAPEYFGFGEVTSKSDIYSLGVIIMQIVTGENKKDFPSIQSVLESWRSRLESDGSQGHTSLETCYLQVNLCYLIGIRCIEHDPGKRPNTRDIIDSLDTLEIMECLVKHDVGNSSLEQMLVCSKVEEPKALPAPPSVSCKLKMAMMVDPPNGTGNHGKHYYTMWQTMFEINTKYMPIKPIGRGAYGIVCSSTNQENNEKVAIKKINNVFDNRVDALRTLRELKLLRHLRHENVIALKDIMMPVHRRSFKDVYLVFELMDTDLHQIIKSSQPLSNDHCQYFLFQLLRGLKYLHSAGILHRDLKPGNLLVNANCDLKICDFGLARTNNTKGQFMTEYVVTRLYRAPELLLCCDNYGTSIDVWSVGCIFAELLGRKPIFPRTQCLDQLKLIVNVLGTMSENDLEFIDNPKARKYIKSLPYTPGTPLTSMYPQAHPLAIDLLQKMLVFDPSKRISVTEALEHPYMSPLYDPSANPPAQVPIDLDIDENLGVEMIREMLWQEMLQYHPEAARMVNM